MTNIVTNQVPSNKDIMIALYEHVGQKFNWNDLQDQGWMYRFNWTAKVRDSYTSWLANYIQSKGTDRKTAEKDACNFVFKFGWQIKN